MEMPCCKASRTSSPPSMGSLSGHGRGCPCLASRCCRSNIGFDGQASLQYARSVLHRSMASRTIIAIVNSPDVQQPVYCADFYAEASRYSFWRLNFYACMLSHFLVVESFTRALTGGGDMVASDGPQWKTWRSAFNPGFSSSHLMTLMPLIVEDVNKFIRILRDHAVSNEPFRMERHATRLTIDIIGKVVLYGSIKARRSTNISNAD